MLTQRKISTRLPLVKSLLQAHKQHRKPFFALLRELLSLRFGQGKLGLTEYFDYGLSDPRFTDLEMKRTFAGWRRWDQIERQAVPERWWAVMEDKLLFYELLAGVGVPIPRIFAVYQRQRYAGATPVLRSPAQLEAFLRHGMTYPFFAKPSQTGRGVGISAIREYVAERDALVSTNGEKMTVPEFVLECAAYAGGGYVFQEWCRPHATLSELCGAALSTIRFVVAVTDREPFVASAAWRIPTGSNIVDNFSQPGNLLAGLDVQTGTVTRLCLGAGVDQPVARDHPSTGKTLVGARIPEWDAACGLCLQCAAIVPEIRLQAWDIAICPGGPVVIEANVAGDVDVPQLANATGILNDRFNAFLATLPGPAS